MQDPRHFDIYQIRLVTDQSSLRSWGDVLKMLHRVSRGLLVEPSVPAMRLINLLVAVAMTKTLDRYSLTNICQSAVLSTVEQLLASHLATL
jgi:hypothetical protein